MKIREAAVFVECDLCNGNKWVGSNICNKCNGNGTMLQRISLSELAEALRDALDVSQDL